MPKIPPGDPVLFVDTGLVAAHIIVRACLGRGIADYHQHVRMLRSLGDLVPPIGLRYGGVRLGLIRQAVRVIA